MYAEIELKSTTKQKKNKENKGKLKQTSLRGHTSHNSFWCSHTLTFFFRTYSYSHSHILVSHTYVSAYIYIYIYIYIYTHFYFKKIIILKYHYVTLCKCYDTDFDSIDRAQCYGNFLLAWLGQWFKCFTCPGKIFTGLATINQSISQSRNKTYCFHY